MTDLDQLARGMRVSIASSSRGLLPKSAKRCGPSP